jgi:hypothetical protein
MMIALGFVRAKSTYRCDWYNPGDRLNSLRTSIELLKAFGANG